MERFVRIHGYRDRAKPYFDRLITASVMTALTGAFINGLVVSLASGEFMPLVYDIFLFSFALTFFIALPVGTFLLGFISYFDLGLIASFLTFLLSGQSAMLITGVVMFPSLSRMDFLLYIFVTLIPICVAWYSSVYVVWKNHKKRN